MSNITEYQNLIELLKKTLEFYANKENWLFYKDKDASAALDEGTQARFALEKIKEFNKNQTDSIEEYVKNIENTLEGNEDVDDLYKKLIELRNIAENEGNYGNKE